MMGNAGYFPLSQESDHDMHILTCNTIRPFASAIPGLLYRRGLGHGVV